MEVSTQITSFFITLLIGVALGIIFDFYRVMRGVFRPKMLMTLLLDGLYWLIALIITFTCLMLNNWAELRFYVFIGMVSGALFYYKLISKYVICVVVYGVRVMFFIHRWIKKSVLICILHPLGYVLGIFLFPFRFTCRKTRKVKEKFVNWQARRKKSGKEEDSDPEI